MVRYFPDPVEVDETYFGEEDGHNMSNSKRKKLANTGRGAVGKTAVVGVKDRATKQVAAKVVNSTNAETLQGFVKDHAAPGRYRLYGRRDGIRRTAFQSCCHQALTLRIRQWRHSHKRNRVTMVNAEASAQGNLSQAVS